MKPESEIRQSNLQKEPNKNKVKLVDELFELMKNKNTILIASIKNLPASQFQEIGKKLRGKAIIKVPKKNLILRAIDSLDNSSIKEIKEYLQDNVAILFSNLDCFDLAVELVDNKSPSKARPGQLAPEDIEVPAGPTELVPGPAISELGALGIQTQIEKGKIHIKQPKIIVKQGEKISMRAADVMNKLDIKPFSIGFIPLLAFDIKNGKLYLEINIDKESTLKELKNCFRKALAFAVEIGQTNDETIKFLINKAGVHEKILENLVKEDKGEIQENDEEKKNDIDNSKIENVGEKTDEGVDDGKLEDTQNKIKGENN